VSERETPGPNLFVVGGAKCGTTSLWTHLAAHPDIYMSTPKEPHFFSRATVPVNQLVKDPVDYAALFGDGVTRRYRGEASTSYLWDPDSAARIRRAVPEARILISLRDPVERAYSNYWGHIRVGLDDRTFAEAVQAELADGNGDLAAIPAPHVKRGFYDEQVPRYLETFGDATLVLLFDELVSDVQGTMASIFEWLELDAAPAQKLDPAPVYSFFMPRNRAVAALRRLPGVPQFANVLLRGPLRARIDRSALLFEKPPMDPGLRRLLRDVYAPHDARLREILGRSLPWDGRE
jgi:hypothetical protein